MTDFSARTMPGGPTLLLEMSNPDYRTRSRTEHRDLLAACRRRDGKKAVSFLRQHLREGSDTLVNATEGGGLARKS
ncbi:FCD domain-containing protein [Mesorhizobium sp. CO1-1-7]|uniref:FCD domain-containing protein n=1 Tax=unclassified Mesorhizobium TaxID=325217 RepID=UPI001CD17323|nr:MULTISPECIES: FCD domain-containing protein [unclassified Mesorhizobium]MBZ9746201.1 FCD domain-containing protein [Mesorhizobium sp. CO1-1-7]